jgi:fimbrial chaperone protein
MDAGVAMHKFSVAMLLALSVFAGGVSASEIAVTPVAVHLDKTSDRATVSVINSGTEPVIMQVEAVEWKSGAPAEQDTPTRDMVINPSVFTVAPGQAQLVRVGLRRAAQAESEGTYRIVLREVPAAPRPGEMRISGQVRVLMALRVPIYVAPANVVRESYWQATQAHDGSITASLRNEGNVHVRVGKIQLRSSHEGSPAVPAEHAAAGVVLAGDSRNFKVRGATPDARPMMIDVITDEGTQTVPVVLARR